MDENRRNIENTAGGKSSLLWLPNSIFTAIEKTADFFRLFHIGSLEEHATDKRNGLIASSPRITYSLLVCKILPFLEFALIVMRI